MALFGGAWAFLPGYLQAARGSHTVITTIMFNFLAAILLNYLLVDKSKLSDIDKDSWVNRLSIEFAIPANTFVIWLNICVFKDEFSPSTKYS